MKKIYYLLIFLIPLLHFSQSNPPPPGLEDPTPVVPIDQIDGILFFTAILIGAYFTFRKHGLPIIPRKKSKKKLNLNKTD